MDALSIVFVCCLGIVLWGVYKTCNLTHTHTHARTHTCMHTRIPTSRTKAISRNQAHAGLRPAFFCQQYLIVGIDQENYGFQKRSFPYCQSKESAAFTEKPSPGLQSIKDTVQHYQPFTVFVYHRANSCFPFLSPETHQLL